MTTLVTPLDPADEVGTRQAFDIVSESGAADVPDFPPPCPQRFYGGMRQPWPGERNVYALARLGDVPVGYLELDLPLLENTGTAEVRLEVLPAYRHRGVGRALLAHAEQVARADGRKKLISTTVSALPDGPPRPTDGDAFARARGAALALIDVRRRLSVETLDHAVLDAMVETALPKATGYSLVRWLGAAPDEYVADAAYLDGRLMTDAPLGDLDLEGPKIDTERFRAQEAARAFRGRRTYTVAARHDASGRVVAITAIDVGATPKWHAFQQITLVDPDHRGHRLGALVKVENLRAVLAAEPEVREIDTWNAAVNSHMITINEQMGFRPVDEWHNWQLAL